MTDKSTSPEVLAELRELLANAQPAPWDLGTGWPFGSWNWNGMSNERKKATERIVVHLVNHASTLLADSERLADAEKKIRELSLECHSYLSQLAQPHEDPRLRLAVEGLERISTYDDDGTWGNARIKDLARDTLAKIKGTA